MQEQNKLAAAGRRHPGTPASSTFDSAAMERQLRQVKGGGIAPAVQAIASRNMKPGGSMSNPAQHQNRSGVQAGVAAASAPAPPAPSNQILKCPRCSSFNTKFCYYNNYSLLQPRHFCKNCRRYWTKGGALRNVPVGGGCRKNKRVTGTTATANGSATDGASLMAMTTSAPSGAAKQSSMNMMIRENTAASCRNSSLTTAPMITNAVQKAALQESMPPQMHTHFPPLYSYTSKNCQIQPAISLSNSAPSFYNATDHSNLSQYPLLNPRLAPFMPPNQAASFHSFLNLKQALSSLASPNHSLISFNASLPPSSALPFLPNDHISTANLDAALQTPIDDPLMGLDLINASTTASLVPLPSLTTAHSTTTSSSLFINNTSSGLTLQQGFNHTNAHSNPAAVRQLKSIVPSSNDKKMNALYREDQQEVQAFGSSLSSRSACKDLQAIHAAAMQQEMHAASSKGLQDMQHAAAIMDQEGQLNMQIMSRSSSMKDELVSDNFKMKGDDNDHDQDSNQPVAGALCCTNAGWGGHRAQRSSFLEASGDDQPYWSCNPSTWHDDLST